MPSKPIDAYQSVAKTTATDREIEAMALSKAAAMLEDVQRQWDSPEQKQLLEEALNYNQRLWSFFQAGVTAAENPLPEEIKTNILVLSTLVDKRIFETLAYPAPEKLNLIININRNIAAGLRGDPG